MLLAVETGPRGTRASNVFMLQKYTFIKSQNSSVRLVIMLQEIIPRGTKIVLPPKRPDRLWSP